MVCLPHSSERAIFSLCYVEDCLGLCGIVPMLSTFALYLLDYNISDIYFIIDVIEHTANTAYQTINCPHCLAQ